MKYLTIGRIPTRKKIGLWLGDTETNSQSIIAWFASEYSKDLFLEAIKHGVHPLKEKP